MTRLNFFLLSCCLMVSVAPTHAAELVICPNGKLADGALLIGNAKACVYVRQIAPTDANPDVLAVFMHGDNSGQIELRTDRGTAFTVAQQLKLSTMALQRPGYRSELGRSDGFNLSRDDDYTEGNVEIVASALLRLRQLNPNQKILLIGHSGGSAMTALVAARFPASADAYVVAACPCDVPTWRQWRQSSAGRAGYWPNSLSPLAEADKMPTDTRIALVVGTLDDNTLPKLSEAFVAKVQAKGVKARLIYAAGANHNSVLRAPEFFQLIGEMAAELSDSTQK